MPPDQIGVKLTIVPTAELSELATRLDAATAAMTMAVIRFGEALETIEALIDAAITPAMEACLTECMLGDTECFDACLEQAAQAPQ